MAATGKEWRRVTLRCGLGGGVLLRALFLTLLVDAASDFEGEGRAALSTTARHRDAPGGRAGGASQAFGFGVAGAFAPRRRLRQAAGRKGAASAALVTRKVRWAARLYASRPGSPPAEAAAVPAWK